MDTFALALVPCGEVDVWLMLALRDGMRKTLGIPVIVRQSRVQVPKPDRDATHLRADDLRARITKARKNAEFDALLRRLKVTTDSLADDEKVFTTVETVLNAERDREMANRFREELAFLRRLGPQWNADPLLQKLGNALAVRPGSGMGYLVVTKLDLYTNENRYVFGSAAPNGNIAIFSYHRFTAAVLDEPPNRTRLKQRALKQALSSVGLLFGLPRCTDPTCSRAYANDLAEHDAKQLKLCSRCQQGFTKRFDLQKH